MTKNELLNKIADINSKIEDALSSVNNLKIALREIVDDIADIPDTPEEITDEKEKE